MKVVLIIGGGWWISRLNNIFFGSLRNVRNSVEKVSTDLIRELFPLELVFKRC